MAPTTSDSGWGRVNRSTQRGRYVESEIALRGGEVVFRERPWAAVLASSESRRRCDWSLAALTANTKERGDASLPLFKSSRDRDVAGARYLSCELRARAALPVGRNFDDLPAVIRLALRSLWRAASKNNESSDDTIPWNGLQDHWHALSDERRSEFIGMGQFCSSILRSGMEDGCGTSLVEPLVAARFLSLLTVNAMHIVDENNSEIALGFYLAASAFNHSENPNCFQMYEGRNLLVRSRFAVSKGSELTITYRELAESIIFHRESFRTQYNFDPLAECGTVAVAEKREALLGGIEERDLSGKSGKWRMVNGILAHWDVDSGFTIQYSNVASTQRSDVERWLHSIHKDALPVLETSKNNPGSNQSTAATSLDRLHSFWKCSCLGESLKLGPGHALRLELARIGMDLAIAAESWSDAARWARIVCDCEVAIYAEFWPVVGYSFARAAKLELYLAKFEEAENAGNIATRILASLGLENTEAFKETRQLQSQACAERRCKANALDERQALTECNFDLSALD